MGLVSLPIGASNSGTNDWSDVHNEDQAIIDQLNGNVEAVNLATGAVTSAKILDGAVTTAKLAAGAISGSTALADGSVTAGKLANDSVTSAKIAAGTIATSDIADNAVTADKLVLGYDQGSDSGVTIATNTSNSLGDIANPTAGTYLMFGTALIRNATAGALMDVDIELRRNTTGLAFGEVTNNVEGSTTDQFTVTLHGLTTASGADDFYMYFNNDSIGSIVVYHCRTFLLRID